MEYKSIYCDQCACCKTDGNATWRRDAICSKCNNGSQQVTGDPIKRNDDMMAAANAYIVAGRANGKTDYYKEIINSVYGSGAFRSQYVIPSIKQVIFNPPATIVIWSDDVKTVVKAHDEQFDPEKGLAMAITKRALGNKGNYNNVINKHVNTYYKRVQEEIDVAKQLVEGLAEGMTKVGESARDAATALANAAATAIDNLTPYRIWYRVYKDGKLVESGMSLKAYKREGNAKAAANKLYKDRPEVTWAISKTNPWIEEKTDSE